MSGPRPSGRYPPDAPDPRYHPGLPMPPAHGIPPRPDFFPPNQQQYNSPRPNFPPPSLPAPPGRYSPAVGPGSGSRAYDERFAPNNAFPPGYGSPGPQGLPLPPKMSYPPREPIPLPRPPLPIDDRMPPPPMRSGSGGGAATPGGAGWQQQGGRVHDERWDYHGGPPPPGGFAGLPPHPGHMGVPQRPPPPSSSAQFPLPPHPGAAAAYPPPRASYPDDRNGSRASTSSSSYRPHSPPRSYSRPDLGPSSSSRYRSPSPDYSRSPRRHRSPSPSYRARERERERDYHDGYEDERHREHRSHHRRPRPRSRSRSPISRSPSPPPRRRRRGSSCSSPGISRSPESPRVRRTSANAKAGVWRRGRSASRTPSGSSDSDRGYRSSRSTSRDRRKRSGKRRHRDEETHRSGGRRKHSPESERRSSGHKRRRSTDERSHERFDDRDDKKAKTAASGPGYAQPPLHANGSRSVYPPSVPQNGAHERASYPPPNALPTGPRAVNDRSHPSTPGAPGNVYPPPGPPLHRPQPQHPNALPSQPVGAVKVQLAPTGPRAPTGPKAARPGFVPIGQQAQHQQQRLGQSAQRVAARTGVPTGPRNGPVAGDVKRFFPGDEDEDEVAKNAPSGPAKGRKPPPPAPADKGMEGPSWEERLGQRDGGAQQRMQDDRSWVTRQGGEVSPPRRQLPPDEDDRTPPSQPMILNPSANGGPPQPAVLHRASYERPGSGPARPAPNQQQQQLRAGGPAQAVPPLFAPRQWGAPPTGPAAQASFTPPGANGQATPTGPASRASSAATPALTAPPSPKAIDRVDSQSLPPPTPSNPPTPVPTAAPTAAAAAAPPPPPPTELYERLVQVGEGTYGKVYKARNVETGGLVALKRIRPEAEKDGFPVTAVREIKLLQTLRHPNVVELVEMLVSKGQVYMVLEYLDHDLTGVLHHPSINFSPAHLKSLMQQFLQGLGFIHRRGVLHRDLKGSNILLSKRGELKIADFGLARFYQRGRNNDYTNRVITQWYKPPELLFGATVYDERVDMWSAGCIFLELFARRPIFPGQDEIHQLDVIFRLTGTPNLDDWPALQDLPWYELVKPKAVIEPCLRQEFAKYLTPAGLDVAEALLALDPARRPTADDALRMPYFVSEEPQAEMPTMLADVEGEWHEYESKRQRRRQRGDEGA
ncbi:hypothetical protein NBRC10512_000321 [Rhodotorula toruloides]|uniref:RHTO0S09e02630g1_1 n=2 Tax=Rhodotorula toruloides TaxID=5286 RepID=A0A061B3C4_RHOTO|nr:cyclin-dependent protein kinase [Rhodotorula toruloides NP11]EMS22945.1 cyclin-dependent protein kinase [Rhodotorula toruloides NP11]CDR44325.1 RHTO0S09e02630g1_1 [Rhodotorula toruloides]